MRTRTPIGAPRRFYEQVVLTFSEDSCLTWPYSRTGSGYAHLVVCGKQRLVTRIVCEELFGPAPTPEHEAAHSCGKGHLGCVNPKHLRWATAVENRSDMIGHGTAMRGEKHGRAKLTAAKVAEIRLLKGRVSLRKLAKMFSVSPSAVAFIQRGQTWANT